MIEWILGIIGLLLLLFVLLAPLESLRWWVDHGEREIRTTFTEIPPSEVEAAPVSHHVVYLSGVGTIGGELSRREAAWLDAIRAGLPGARIVDDVFPYATDNRGLLQRTTEWAWGRLDRMRRTSNFPRLLPLLIEIRNIAQVLVSADPRYGPTFNVGLAQEIWRSLQKHGYRPRSGDPVILIGFSGGAQTALGAGWVLAGLGVPVTLISVGGIFGSDPGLDRVQHIYHLTGRRDRLHWIGNIAFPGRWPIAPFSPWGRAKREGRVTNLRIGDMAHAGADGYMGRRAHGRDGRSHFETSVSAVTNLAKALPSGRVIPRNPDKAH